METIDNQINPIQKLPNATAVLVLGIISIPTCCCYGVVGITLAIIALVLAAKDRKLYSANPGQWDPKTYSNLNAGRICAIIGLILGILYLILVIIELAVFGWAAMQDPSEMQNRLRELLGQ